MGEEQTSGIMEKIKAGCDKNKVEECVNAYGNALTGKLTELQLAEILLSASKESLVVYILSGFESVRKQFGKQIEIMQKKGLI